MNFDWIKQPPGFLKIIALALSVTALALFLNHGGGFRDYDVSRYAVIIIPSTAFVLAYFLLSYVLDGGYGKFALTELIFDAVHGVSSIVVASFSLSNSKHNSDEVIAFGVVLLGVAIVLLVDAFFVFKNRN